MILNLKAKYTCTENLNYLIEEYNKIFNELKNYVFTTTTRQFLYDLFKNKTIETFLPSQFWNSLIWAVRNNNLDTKKPLFMLGAKGTGKVGVKGNRYFQIISENQIKLTLNKDTSYILNLKLDKNLRSKLLQLKELQDQRKIALTYSLFEDVIQIDYSLEEFVDKNYKPIKDRIFSIDLNPNYIGCSVVDWKSSTDYKIIDSFILDLKELNKCKRDKRINELKEISNWLINRCKYYKCEIFSIEDIKEQDKFKSTQYILVNRIWKRTTIVNQLEKLSYINDITFLKAPVAYSSFLGNLIFREENKPDPILASIEVGRRNYEFYHQYIQKDNPVNKTIYYNDKFNEILNESLNDLGAIVEYQNIKDLYNKLKSLNIQYRVPLRKSREVFRLKSCKSKILIYKF